MSITWQCRSSISTTRNNSPLDVLDSLFTWHLEHDRPERTVCPKPPHLETVSQYVLKLCTQTMSGATVSNIRLNRVLCHLIGKHHLDLARGRGRLIYTEEVVYKVHLNKNLLWYIWEKVNIRSTLSITDNLVSGALSSTGAVLEIAVVGCPWACEKLSFETMPTCLKFFSCSFFDAKNCSIPLQKLRNSHWLANLCSAMFHARRVHIRPED